MHNGINTNYYLAIGAEKTSGIQLLLKSGERQVYNMLLSAFLLPEWINSGLCKSVTLPISIQKIKSPLPSQKAGAVAFFLFLQALN